MCERVFLSYVFQRGDARTRYRRGANEIAITIIVFRTRRNTVPPDQCETTFCWLGAALLLQLTTHSHTAVSSLCAYVCVCLSAALTISTILPLNTHPLSESLLCFGSHGMCESVCIRLCLAVAARVPTHISFLFRFYSCSGCLSGWRHDTPGCFTPDRWERFQYSLTALKPTIFHTGKHRVALHERDGTRGYILECVRVCV